MRGVSGWLKRLRQQFGSLWQDRTRSVELDREFEFHVEMEAEALIAAGMSAGEARRRALLSFGGAERYKEEMRDGWLRRCVADAGADVRYALRGLRRTPVFTVTAVATLAIGLGGAVSLFTAVQAVRAPLPYDDEAALVRIFQRNSATNRWSLSVVDVQGIEAWQRSFSAVVAVRRSDVALSGVGEPVWVRAAAATVGLFETFGVQVARGRPYQHADAEPDAPAVAVISDALARRHFGGIDPIGRPVLLDRVQHTVIGVLPAGLAGLGGISADVWPLLRLETPTRRGPFGLAVFARLRPGVTHEAAAADLAAISARLFPMHEASFGDRTATLVPYALREILLGDAPKSLAVLVAGVLLILLIALANVSNLVLVRASGRSRELALRAALGAGRHRLARLLLTENLVLAGLGGMGAGFFALVPLGMLRGVAPALPGLHGASPDARTVAFTLLLAVGCGIVIALYPLAFSAGREPADALRSGGRNASHGPWTRVFQDGLVVAEFALALPLLAGAALLLHSFVQLQRVDTGVDAGNVITLAIALPATAYATPADRARFWGDALREVAALPGVISTGVASSLPPDNGGDTNNFNLVDRPVPAGGAEPVAPWSSVTPGFFGALRVPLLDGRSFDDRDHADGPPVLLVSAAWAQRHYPGESPLGRQLIEGGCTACPRSTIVGVVGDIKYGGLMGSGEGVYVPYAQWPRATMHLVVRAAGDPLAILESVRATLRAIDPALPLADAQRLQDRLAQAIDGPRRWTVLGSALAALAVLLAGLGVFGVLAYVVSRQQRELGVRLALGASPASIMALVLRRGLVPAGLGTVLGLLLALQGTRVLAHVLHGVSVNDASTLGGVAVVLMMIAGLACWLPGRRAAAVDPVRVITAE
jgi:predicted permease